MISGFCPTCSGECYGMISKGMFLPANGDDPCPTCQDPTGQPTGRICILSTKELEQLDWELVGQKDPRTEAIWSDVVEEMTFRKTGEEKNYE